MRVQSSSLELEALQLVNESRQMHTHCIGILSGTYGRFLDAHSRRTLCINTHQIQEKTHALLPNKKHAKPGLVK